MTVKTDTQTLTEQEDGTWKLTGLRVAQRTNGGTSSVRNIEETCKADEVEVTDNDIDWSNAKKPRPLPSTSPRSRHCRRSKTSSPALSTRRR